jgi:hypothetical protein
MADLVRIFNNDSGSVSYATPKITRTFSIKESYKDVSVEEIQDALNELGVRFLFEEGILLIKDPKVREHFGFSELDDYIKDTDEIKEILNGDRETLIDFLKYCSETMLQKIVDVAVDLEDVKMDYIVLIEKFSGKDISSMIKERVSIKSPPG